MKLMIVVAGFALLLGGCGSLDRSIEPLRIIPLPSETIAFPVSLASGGSANCTLAPVEAGGAIPSEMQLFAQAMYCAYTSGSSTEPWVRRFVEKGIALSDQTCGLFFDTLERRRIDASYAQTNMNIGGTAVTAILVGAGHHARSAFNVATALALGNAWYENYKSNYVLTPQLGRLHRKLQTDVRRPIGDAMKAKAAANQYASFDLAKGDVQSYDELCSHKSVIFLLEEAIAAAEIQTFNSAPTDNDSAQAEVLKERLYTLAAPEGTQAFAKGQVEQLYIVATTQNIDRRKKIADAVSRVDDAMKPYVASLKLNEDAPVAEAVALLVGVGRLMRLDASPMVNQYRLQIEGLLNKGSETPAPAAGALPPPDGTAKSSTGSTPQGKTITSADRTKWSEARNLPSSLPSPNINFEIKVTKPLAGR